MTGVSHVEELSGKTRGSPRRHARSPALRKPRLVREFPRCPVTLPVETASAAKEIHDAGPGVVVSSSFDLPRLQRRHRLRPIDGLDLRLLVEAGDDGVPGRVEVQPHDVAHLLGERRAFAGLERVLKVRLEIAGLQDLVNAGSPRPEALDGSRADQCESPAGEGLFTVVATSHTSFSGTSFPRPGLRRSASPSPVPTSGSSGLGPPATPRETAASQPPLRGSRQRRRDDEGSPPVSRRSGR